MRRTVSSITRGLARMVLVSASLAACAPFSRQTVAPAEACTTDTSTQSAADLIAAERAIGVANIHHDRRFFDQVEATEFLFTGAAGDLTNKTEDLASVTEPPAAGAAVLETYTVDDTRVCAYGNTAVVWGRATTTGRRGDGTTYRTASRFTDTFVWRDDRWQLVAGHSSRLPAPAAPRAP